MFFSDCLVSKEAFRSFLVGSTLGHVFRPMVKSVGEKEMKTEIGRLVMAVCVLLARRFGLVISDLEQWHQKVGATTQV
jgi:hypothetical protein